MDASHPKKCRKCTTIKTIDHFGIDKGTRDGYASRCLICKREEGVQFRTQYPEKSRAKTAKWRAAHPEDYRASLARGRTKKNIRRRARYQENKTKENVQAAAWHAAHPGYSGIKSQRRRARQLGIEDNDLSAAQWREILDAFQHRCAYCPPECKTCKRKAHKLQQEHIQPVMHGGGYTIHNIVPSCPRCNLKKHTGPPPKPVQPLLLTVALARKPKTPAS